MSFAAMPGNEYRSFSCQTRTHPPQGKHSILNATLIGFGAAILLLGTAYAQNHTSEAVPQTNTKPQVAAEAKKDTKPMGTKPIKDGSTAEGQGSGVKKTTRPEAAGQAKAAAREARPHKDLVRAAHRNSQDPTACGRAAVEGCEDRPHIPGPLSFGGPFL